MRDGIVNKLNDLILNRSDQKPQFEEVFRRNWVKSLDHRSFQYNREFIKKFQQKTQHISEIRALSLANQGGSLRHKNLLKGGNLPCSPFYHSFGNFLKNETTRLLGDAMPEDHPMDMRHLDAVHS